MKKLAQAVQTLDRRYSAQTPLTPQLGRLSQQTHAGPKGAAARQLVVAERSLLQERSRYITDVARGEKNVVQRSMDHLREQWTYVTTGQSGVLDDAVKNFDTSLQRIRTTGQLFQAGKIAAPAVQTQVQHTGQAFIKEQQRVSAVQAKQLEWGMAAANVTRDVSAIVAATGVTIGTGGNIFLGAAAGYGVKELGDLAIEGVGSTGGHRQRQMTADRSWVYHLGTQARSGQWGGWEATGKALRREGGDLAWSTVDAVGANYIAKATTALALRWAPQLFKGAAAANPALKLEFLARGGLASGGYQQALPGLFMQQKASTVLASATAAGTWQFRRGIGEIGTTAAQVAEQGQLFSAQGRKTVGDKAFEQLVALPFASLSSGTAALLPNVGRFAIPSQALSDTSFGVVEGQITTWQSMGRGMNDLELFTRTYASGLGSANNLILHPNTLQHAAARAAAAPADQHLPALDRLAPQQRGQVIAEQMREAIAQHRAGTADPARLTAVLAWANEGASIRGADRRTSRRDWEATDRAAYVALGAEINRRLSNTDASAARGAVQDGATAQPSGPSALVRATDAAVARSNIRPFKWQVGAEMSEADRLLARHDVPRSMTPGTSVYRAASKMRMAMDSSGAETAIESLSINPDTTLVYPSTLEERLGKLAAEGHMRAALAAATPEEKKALESGGVTLQQFYQLAAKGHFGEQASTPTTYANFREILLKAGLLEDFQRILNELPPAELERAKRGEMSPVELLSHQAVVRAQWTSVTSAQPLPVLLRELQRAGRLEEFDAARALLSADQIKALAGGAMSPAELNWHLTDAEYRTVDVVIIGAGAAGLTTAQRLRAQGLKVAVLKATASPGGRAKTDNKVFGSAHAFDRGAAWFHDKNINPLEPVAKELGFTLVPDKAPGMAFDGNGGDPRANMQEFLAAEQKVEKAWLEAARAGLDIAVSESTPEKIGRWTAAAAYRRGPLVMGVETPELSVADYARQPPEQDEWITPQGLGAVIASFAHGVHVRYNTPVKEVRHGPGGATVIAGGQQWHAKFAVVTVPTGVLNAEIIQFVPKLPGWKIEANMGLPMGSFNKIALQFKGDIFPNVSDGEHALDYTEPDMIEFVLKPGGDNVVWAMVGGDHARQLAAQSDEVAIEAVLARLERLFGPEVRSHFVKGVVTNWDNDPWARGAFSTALPGHANARTVYEKPVGSVFFAGEAGDLDWAGCVTGAMCSGTRAAESILKQMAQQPEQENPAPVRADSTEHILTNIETAWQKEVSDFLAVANSAQVNKALSRLKDHGFPKVAEWLTQESAQPSPPRPDNSTADQDPVKVLIDKLLHTIPDQVARDIDKLGLQPEEVRDLTGRLVIEEGVSALVGYRLHEALEESGDESWARQPQATPPHQQGRQRGKLAEGDIAATRLTRFIGSFPHYGNPASAKFNPAPHLRITSQGARPRDRFDIIPDQLLSYSRQAYDRLEQTLGSRQRLNDMARSLVVGYVSNTGQELVGLRALAEAWRDAAATDPSLPPLTGSMLVDFGKAVFNHPKFGRMEDLQALVAVEIPIAGFSGLLHPTADINYVSPWVAPANDKLQQFQGLNTSSLSQEQIQQSHKYLDYLRRVQTTLDDEPIGNRQLQSPWHDSNDPGFKDTLAAREAFWLALWNAGLKDKAPNLQHSLELQHWGELIRIAPELEHMNFAGSFIEQHDNMMQVLPQALVPYERPIGALQVQVEALRLIENTFAGRELREKLRYYLHVFEHPGALHLYGNSPEFQHDAAKIATDLLLEQAPAVTSPWAIAELRRQAEGVARSLAAQAGDTSGNNWLHHLETLVTSNNDSIRLQRSRLLTQAAELQKKGSEILDNLEALLSEHGYRPRDSATTAESLLEAVVERLGRSGIQITPKFGSIPAQVSFVVNRNPITGISYAETSSAVSSVLPLVMDHLMRRLQSVGYIGTWAFEGSSPAGSVARDQRQQEQQPQQAPSAQNPEFDSNDPRTRRQGFVDRLPPDKRGHLSWQDDNSVSVIKEQLGFTQKAVFDTLVADLGGKNSGLGVYRLNLMLNALIMGHDGEIGLPALAKAWLAQAGDLRPPPWPTLTGTRLASLAQVAFNDERASTLGAMASLIDIDSPTYRGILPPSGNAMAWHQFQRVLSDNGLPLSSLDKLEAELKKLNPSDFKLNQNGLLPGMPTKVVPPGQSLDWAHVVSGYPKFANLDFAKIFGGQDVLKAEPGQPQSAVAESLEGEFIRYANKMLVQSNAQKVAERTFKDALLQSRLSQYLIEKFSDPTAMNTFAQNDEFKVAATNLVIQRLIDESNLELPRSLIDELRAGLIGLANQRLKAINASDSETMLSALEDVVMSQSNDAIAVRNLLLARLQVSQLLKQRDLLSDLAEGLTAMGMAKKPADESSGDMFRTDLLETLNQFHIDARLKPRTNSGTRTLVVTPWHWNSPALDPALNKPLTQAMNYVVDRLTQAGYPTRWELDEAEPPLGFS